MIGWARSVCTEKSAGGNDYVACAGAQRENKKGYCREGEQQPALHTSPRRTPLGFGRTPGLSRDYVRESNHSSNCFSIGIARISASRADCGLVHGTLPEVAENHHFMHSQCAHSTPEFCLKYEAAAECQSTISRV